MKQSCISNSVDKPSNQDDLRVIRNIKQGNSRAYAEIIKKYEALLYRKVFLKIGNEDDAKDLLQEFFLRVYLKIDMFKPEYTFNAWMTGILDRFIVDYIRKINKRNRALGYPLYLDTPIENETGGVLTLELVDDSIPTISEESYEKIHSRQFEALSSLIQTLKPRDQKLLQMFFLERKRQTEIALVLGMEDGAVRTQVNRLKDRLRRMAVENNLLIRLEL